MTEPTDEERTFVRRLFNRAPVEEPGEPVRPTNYVAHEGSYVAPPAPDPNEDMRGFVRDLFVRAD